MRTLIPIVASSESPSSKALLIDQLTTAIFIPLHCIALHCIDENLTARKKCNIRDNIFVVGAISNSVINGKQPPIETTVTDVENMSTSSGFKPH